MVPLPSKQLPRKYELLPKSVVMREEKFLMMAGLRRQLRRLPTVAGALVNHLSLVSVIVFRQMGTVAGSIRLLFKTKSSHSVYL